MASGRGTLRISTGNKHTILQVSSSLTAEAELDLPDRRWIVLFLWWSYTLRGRLCSPEIRKPWPPGGCFNALSEVKEHKSNLLSGVHISRPLPQFCRSWPGFITPVQ